MERRAVEVFVPAVNKKYDVLLPETMKIGTATRLVAELVSEQEQITVQSENLIMGIMDTKELLEDDITVDGAHIYDGSTLILL